MNTMNGLRCCLLLVGLMWAGTAMGQKEVKFGSLKHKEGNIWIFGNKCTLDFNNFTDTIADNNDLILGYKTELINKEGVATICDSTGKLLFYTRGSTAFNRNHDQMVNGDNLKGSASSAQCGVIVPQPKTKGRYYYIFTVYHRGEGDIAYSKVDMWAESGVVIDENGKRDSLGAVIEKGVNLGFNGEEKITAAVHANQQSIWVITRGIKSNQYHLFLVDDTGVKGKDVLPADIGVQSLGIKEPANTGAGQGYMKASPDGHQVAFVQMDGRIQVVDFNPSTGRLTGPASNNGQPIVLSVFGVPYGLEFSPDGTKLYISEWQSGSDRVNLYQFDLAPGGNPATQEEIQATRVTIGTLRDADPGKAHAYGAIQVGIDERLYVAMDRTSEDLFNTPTDQEMEDAGADYLGRIEKPNEPGAACQYVKEAVALGTRTVNRFGIEVPEKYSHQRSRIGLPTFIQTYFNPCQSFIEGDNILCGGDPVILKGPTSSSTFYAYEWLKVDKKSSPNKKDWTYESLGDTSRTQNTRQISEPGFYALRIVAWKNPAETCVDTSGVLQVTEGEKPDAGMAYTDSVYFVCENSMRDSLPMLRVAPDKQKPEYNYTWQVNTSARGVAPKWGIGRGTNFTTEYRVDTSYINRDYGVRLFVRHNNGCVDSTDEVRFKVIRSPHANLDDVANPTFCPRESVTLTALDVENFGLQWLFNGQPIPGANGPTYAATDTGLYSVEYTLDTVAVNGKAKCRSVSQEIELFFYPAPTAAFTPKPILPERSAYSIGQKITFENESTPGPDFDGRPTTMKTNEWEFGDGSDKSFDKDAVHAYKLIGDKVVKLVVENEYGCKAETTVTIPVSDLPVLNNVFTPNGDGTNDFFFINTSSLKDLLFIVYDRWGREMFRTTDLNSKGWPGTDPQNGGDAVPSQYYYYIKYESKTGIAVERVSSFTLLR